MPDENTLAAEALAQWAGLTVAELHAAIGGTVKPVDGKYSVRAIPAAFDFLREQIDFVSTKEISEMLDVSSPRVSIMLREGVISQNGNGKYERRKTMYALFRWMRERMGEGKTTLSAAKLDARRMENELLEIAVAKAKGTTIPVEVVEKAWADVVMLCRQKFLRLGNKIAPRIPFLKSESEIESELQREIDEALSELSRPVEYQTASEVKLAQ